tara:strand:- start:501 stop:617 length:117 start_codon:yes stop_codon:yes gene_type:complete
LKENAEIAKLQGAELLDHLGHPIEFGEHWVNLAFLKQT